MTERLIDFILECPISLAVRLYHGLYPLIMESYYKDIAYQSLYRAILVALESRLRA